ncbi:globin domain-containing protein [Actimicrobium antarcticum]
MISASARPYIDASVPVLRAHGLAITTTFYRNMFVAHPELTNLFNMGNQASGVQQQSLAAAVFAYAANIGNTAALGPVIERIVQKHLSVGIRAEHYPIVGQYLIGAIQETLGDAATAPLLAAWVEAYDSLARLLINAEKKAYAQAGIMPGQLRNMRVTQRHNESTGIVSFVLEPMDGDAVPSFKPGQYISVAVDLGDGHRQLRQYSLSDAPGLDHLRISVKRELAQPEAPRGEVSNWIHDNIKEGSVLQVTHPFGEFTPDTESAEPIVLLSAGIGITPMIAVLNRIAIKQPSRPMIFSHAARDSDHLSHRRDLDAAQARMPNLQIITFLETTTAGSSGDQSIVGQARTGLMEIAQLPSWPRSETNVYLCGPIGFMKAQWQALVAAGVPLTHVHREVFGPEMLDTLI